MSDFYKNRINFINNWPDSEPFEVEKNYLELVDKYVTKYGKYPYVPMKLWESPDKRYNYIISFIIDALDVVKKYPHHAFAFIFRGIDQYGKFLYAEENETKCLKIMAEAFASLAKANSDVEEIFTTLFEDIPFSVNKFLFAELYKSNTIYTDNKAYKRLIYNLDNTENALRKDLIDAIYNKYGYESDEYGDSIRKGSKLLNYIFQHEKVDIDGTEYDVTLEIKLHFLLSGILYSLRNDYMHGLAISTGKSSMASLKRYAMNYYCFLAASMITNVLLIEGASTIKKEDEYKKLKENVAINVKNMQLLFGKRNMD